MITGIEIPIFVKKYSIERFHVTSQCGVNLKRVAKMYAFSMVQE